MSNTILSKPSKARKEAISALAKDLVAIEHSVPVTSSTVVAQAFGKRHDHVLRDIQKLITPPKSHRAKLHGEIIPNDAHNSQSHSPILGSEIIENRAQNSQSHDPKLDREISDREEFMRRNFFEASYKSPRGREEPMFLMTEEGFMLVVMGFTGDEALRWKIKFITAFQRMRSEIMRRKTQALDFDWQQSRKDGKVARREMTDATRTWMEKAESQGSKNAARYWIHLTKLAYKVLFEPPKTQGAAIRDCLTSAQLRRLATVENTMKTLLDGLALLDTDYHDDYQTAKAKLIEIGKAFGREAPGNEPPLTPALPMMEVSA